MIKIEAVTKTFGTKTILQELTFEVKKNEFLSLLGPNGCGKTTTLNVISGLTRPDSGSITINGVLIDGKKEEKTIYLPPCDRKVGYVFQTTALFPHMRVRDNVSYGLKAKHLPKHEVKSRIRSLLEFVGMHEYAEYFPHQISGGQKQLVSLARSLATDPEVLLLDEPLSAVDTKVREVLRSDFKRLLRSLSITAIYVTHDLTEAFMMSDRIAVMGNGGIEQIGSRKEILDRPDSQYVAEFLGLNVYTAKINHEPSGQTTLDINGVQVSAASYANGDEKTVLVTLKPEDVLLSSEQGISNPKWASCNCNIIKGKIVEIILLKSIAQVTVDVGFLVKAELTISSLSDLGLFEGDRVCVRFKVTSLNLAIKNNKA